VKATSSVILFDTFIVVIVLYGIMCPKFHSLCLTFYSRNRILVLAA
jgi:hypothetical protein